MKITISRRWLYVAIALLVTLTAAALLLTVRQPAAAASGPDSSTAAQVMGLARDLTSAFGRGDLYRSPNKYPLTDELTASITQLPNRAATWPTFVGLAGEAVVVLQGREADGTAFIDVVDHVLSQSPNHTAQLTELDLRLIQENGAWKADRILTLPKGSVQP